MHDVGTLPPPSRALLLDPDSYAASQRFGARLREQGSNGIVYPSVRHHGGRCVGAFRPPAVGLPMQTKHLKYHYDDTRVVEYFDYERARWIALSE